MGSHGNGNQTVGQSMYKRGAASAQDCYSTATIAEIRLTCKPKAVPTLLVVTAVTVEMLWHERASYVFHLRQKAGQAQQDLACLCATQERDTNVNCAESRLQTRGIWRQELRQFVASRRFRSDAFEFQCHS